MIHFYGYSRCSTSRKAEQFLKENEIPYRFTELVSSPPSKEELRKMIATSDKPIRRFFNTSGILYRELGLSAKVKTMGDEELLELLASDGRLIKRPLVTDGKATTVGFDAQFEECWGAAK